MNNSKNHQLTAQLGQSLIEVTFAAAVVGLVLVAVLSTVIASLQQARIALEQTQATQHGQAALEWIRSSRDQAGWGPFYDELADKGLDQTYCWEVLPETFDAWLQEGTETCDILDPDAFLPGTQITRQVQVQVVAGPPESVQLTVTLTRPGQNGPAVSTITSTLEDWE